MDIDEEKLFFYRLAHEFGIINVKELYDLPASVIRGWKDYFSIYPFKEDREDVRSALLRATIYNMSGKSMKVDVDPQDLILDYLEDFKHRTASKEQKRNEKNLRYIQMLERIKASPAGKKAFIVKPKK